MGKISYINIKNDERGNILNYPKNEQAETSYYNKNHELRFVLTSKPMRSSWVLYEYDATSDSLIKQGEGSSPPDVEEKFNVIERLSNPGAIPVIEDKPKRTRKKKKEES